jgi:hypothetical protein
MMKKITAISIITGILCIISFANSGSSKKPVPPAIENAPSITLLQAVQIAKSHLEKSGVDTSQHYLDNVRLLHSSSWMKGKHWIITWKRGGPRPVMGGEIFVFVDMDKNVKKQGGI